MNDQYPEGVERFNPPWLDEDFVDKEVEEELEDNRVDDSE